jgi:rhodanese-related sulfurtransferase
MEFVMRSSKILASLFVYFTLLMGTGAVRAADASPVVKAIEDYMDFNEYGSSLIWPEQIPAEDWKNVFVVDARDAAQFAKDHIPGAVNIEWRQAVARRGEIPKDRMVVVYCNSGSLSAQAVFALRLIGYDNVKVLQDGFEGWKAKGGFEANKRASRPAGH